MSVSAYAWPSVLVGGVTVMLIVVLERTRSGAPGMVLSIVAGSVLVEVLGLERVAQMRDIASVRVVCRRRSCLTSAWRSA